MTPVSVAATVSPRRISASIRKDFPAPKRTVVTTATSSPRRSSARNRTVVSRITGPSPAAASGATSTPAARSVSVRACSPYWW